MLVHGGALYAWTPQHAACCIWIHPPAGCLPACTHACLQALQGGWAVRGCLRACMQSTGGRPTGSRTTARSARTCEAPCMHVCMAACTHACPRTQACRGGLAQSAWPVLACAGGEVVKWQRRSAPSPHLPPPPPPQTVTTSRGPCWTQQVPDRSILDFNVFSCVDT